MKANQLPVLLLTMLAVFASSAIGSTPSTLSTDDKSRLLCYMLSGERNLARSYLSLIKKDEIHSDVEADAVLNKISDTYLSESTTRVWASLEKKKIEGLIVLDGLSMQEIAAKLNILGQGDFKFEVADSLKQFKITSLRLKDLNLKYIVMLISDCTGGSVFALADGKVMFLSPNYREPEKQK
jgi:hypothetical protein